MPVRKQFRRNPLEKNLRCNEQIRITPIRLIGPKDEQIGVVETREALLQARAAGLDLVEVAPTARPPVCRIMDYGKWKYAQKKKEQKSVAKRHETELKEIRIKTPKIGDHDLEIKIKNAREFLGRGDRVQFSLRFRGRELAHIDEGRRIFGKIQQDLADCAKVDQSYRFEAKRATMTLASTGAAAAAKPAAKPPKPAAPKGDKPADKAGAPAQHPAPAAQPQAAPAPDTQPAPQQPSPAEQPK